MQLEGTGTMFLTGTGMPLGALKVDTPLLFVFLYYWRNSSRHWNLGSHVGSEQNSIPRIKIFLRNSNVFRFRHVWANPLCSLDFCISAKIFFRGRAQVGKIEFFLYFMRKI